MFDFINSCRVNYREDVKINPTIEYNRIKEGNSDRGICANSNKIPLIFSTDNNE